MLRFISCLFIVGLFCLAACQRRHQRGFSKRGQYYYQLMAFSNNSAVEYEPGRIVHLALTYSTQQDSVFWDSYNNNSDQFYFPADSSNASFLKQYSSLCSAGDSVCLLVKPADFFLQQFQSPQVPFFSSGDSVVKIRFKVKEVLSPQAYAILKFNPRQRERQLIRSFYKSEADFNAAKDSLGFYWVEKPAAASGKVLNPGDAVSVQYRGYYLNGRLMEVSPEKFEIIYGAPDQLLKGVNYVIGRIKIGQNAKIILPSRLAFGENGNAGLLVPPYTPLLYEIKLTERVKQE